MRVNAASPPLRDDAVIMYRYPSAPLEKHLIFSRGVVVPVAMRTPKANGPRLSVHDTALGMSSELGSTTDPWPELPPLMVGESALARQHT